jgi:hypothetical protein
MTSATIAGQPDEAHHDAMRSLILKGEGTSEPGDEQPLPQATCPCYTFVEEAGQASSDKAVTRHVKACAATLRVMAWEGQGKHVLLESRSNGPVIAAARWFMTNKDQWAGVPDSLRASEHLDIVAGVADSFGEVDVGALVGLCLVQAFLGVSLRMDDTAVFGSIAEDSGVIGEGTRADWAPRADAQDRLQALVDVGVKRLVVPAGWVMRLSVFAAKAGLDIHGVHTMDELIYLLAPQAFKLQPSTMPLVVELSDVVLIPLDYTTSVRRMFMQSRVDMPLNKAGRCQAAVRRLRHAEPLHPDSPPHHVVALAVMVN